mmetsp:Transcript_42669/g.133762  ORF Transcript_42669/g.133762 Transcript_42669/m.133762 type:complete len:334 (+) Transcript_42669:131-1132(+)|eukprot:CAMPEP_0118883794 /NCGR_PEP_ID=MMETSP1163-20130328/22797_1 /TAXON_ID=124430 /ORGANISM="Phaeomonas parva, Strain CCMP2877" /LENGTH=333 /DNA_ID=CAMNT_0006821341 /DNA_START=120 /DNA_END=1121 /DNA_ORIENTATION=+
MSQLLGLIITIITPLRSHSSISRQSTLRTATALSGLKPALKVLLKKQGTTLGQKTTVPTGKGSAALLAQHSAPAPPAHEARGGLAIIPDVGIKVDGVPPAVGVATGHHVAPVARDDPVVRHAVDEVVHDGAPAQILLVPRRRAPVALAAVWVREQERRPPRARRRVEALVLVDVVVALGEGLHLVRDEDLQRHGAALGLAVQRIYEPQRRLRAPGVHVAGQVDERVAEAVIVAHEVRVIDRDDDGLLDVVDLEAEGLLGLPDGVQRRHLLGRPLPLLPEREDDVRVRRAAVVRRHEVRRLLQGQHQHDVLIAHLGLHERRREVLVKGLALSCR